MKYFLFLILLCVICASGVSAQTSADSNEGTFIGYAPSNPTSPFSFNFWGRNGFIYFIEETDDLTTSWNYVEIGILGSDAAEIVDFDSPFDALFMRLVFTNDPFSPFFIGSFDNDSISNYDQILMGMNPFVDEGPLNLAGDEDGDDVLNEFDAAPFRASVDTLSISISSPASGSTVN